MEHWCLWLQPTTSVGCTQRANSYRNACSVELHKKFSRGCQPDALWARHGPARRVSGSGATPAHSQDTRRHGRAASDLPEARVRRGEAMKRRHCDPRHAAPTAPAGCAPSAAKHHVAAAWAARMSLYMVVRCCGPTSRGEKCGCSAHCRMNSSAVNGSLKSIMLKKRLANAQR